MLSVWLPTTWVCLVALTVGEMELETCSRKWVKMDDHNYNKAIRHYEECSLLGQALDPPARHKYQTNIIMNMKKTCNYFFERTSLSTSHLIGVVRELAKILEDFDDETATKPNESSWKMVVKSQPGETPCRQDEDAVTTEPPKRNRTEHGNCDDEARVGNRRPSITHHSDDRNSQGYLLVLLVFFLVLLVVQMIFIIWLCCYNNCICMEFCRTGNLCICDNEISKDDLPETTDVYCMHGVQHDLVSLSSENVGSDSEFEALLKMNRLPKCTRNFDCKDID